MPIHLPKKREEKGGGQARDSERNELNPGAKCLSICITLQGGGGWRVRWGSFSVFMEAVEYVMAC